MLVRLNYITFFFLKHCFFLFRNYDRIRLHARITESVDIFSSDTKIVTLTRYHGIPLSCYYRVTQRMTRLGDYHPRAFTDVFCFHSISDYRATSVVRWRLPNNRSLTSAEVYTRFIREWFRWT